MSLNQPDDQWVVPMFESERGWGSKIDGHAGPFDSFAAADDFKRAYNLKHNNAVITPDWYIVAMEPVLYKGQRCDYKMTVEA